MMKPCNIIICLNVFVFFIRIIFPASVAGQIDEFASGYSLHGVCFEDTNKNGNLDATERGIDNATVSLSRLVLGFFLMPINTQQTDNSGAYEFLNLKQGFYHVGCKPSIEADTTNTNPAIVLLSFLNTSRTVDFGFAPAAVEVLPVWVSITADPRRIKKGDSTTLYWESENADTIRIDNDIGEVDSTGTMIVFPQDNATYIIMAEGPGGTASDNVTIAVDPIPPPPPPTTSVLSTTTSTIASGGGGGGGGGSHSSSSTSSSTTTGVMYEPPSPVTGFIAASSDKKIGLAWINPNDENWASTLVVRNADDYAQSPSEGDWIYDGTGSDWIDEDLTNGITYYYTAFAYSTGPNYAEAIESSRASATPQSVATADWTDWQNQPDPFADEVIIYEPAIEIGEPFGYDDFPWVVLGPPSGGGEFGASMDVLSLGARSNDDNGTSAPYGGYIIVKFTDNIIVNGDGNDFTVFENPFLINNGGRSGTFIEPAVVSISQDGTNFYQLPCDFIPLAMQNPEPMEIIEHCTNHDHYPSGFTGINPVLSSDLVPDPTDPDVSGGDSFDIESIEETSLYWIQYVKIESTGDNWLTDNDGDMIRHNPETGACSGGNNSGFDLDALSAINY